VNHAKQLLAEIGIEPERLEMFNIGASDAPLFAKACNEMTQRARDLGPNPLRSSDSIASDNGDGDPVAGDTEAKEGVTTE
jgi:F420-non-reducing hydrogenase iron-sulfur subunit